jgi:hypothetical protein
MKRLFSLATLFFTAIFLVLAGCSADDGKNPYGPIPNPGDPTPIVSGVGSVILTSSKLVLKPDNTDSAEITATVLSDSNVLLSGVQVSFSTTGGAINAATATTDSSGKAKITFTSGTLKIGDSATVTAKAGTAQASITIQAADDRIPAELAISAVPASVKSNDIEESLITVTVLNASGGIIANQSVSFKADGGRITTTSAMTDNNGKATTSFFSGTNKINRTAQVTITVGSLTEIIPIVVYGSTLNLTPSTSPVTLAIGQSEQLTVTAKDASNNPVSNVDITFAQAGTGKVNLSVATAVTNANGQAVVEVTGATQGGVTLSVTGLGATVTKTYDVSGEHGADFFRIVEPASNSSSASLNQPLTVRVYGPAPTTQVLFATTMGKWGNGFTTQTIPLAGGFAEAQLTTSLAGIANIQVSDKDRPTISDAISISFSAAADTAESINLQASATNVAVTLSGGSPQQVELRATVRDVDQQVVGGAPVAFNIEKSTGGGEYIIPPVAYTNDQGQATTTFTSGSLQGDVIVRGSLVDFPEKSDQRTIHIGGTAMSITLGRATEITELSPTTYSLPMSVLVSDGNGGPVSGQAISLTVWPRCYFASDLQWYANEDINRNKIMDAGEDINDDKELTPPASAAGNIVPSPPIETDTNGLGNFNLIYLKADYNTYVEVKATALVGGSETSSTLKFHLPVADKDKDKLPLPTHDPAPAGLGVCRTE